jgi:hypothetical protein
MVISLDTPTWLNLNFQCNYQNCSNVFIIIRRLWPAVRETMNKTITGHNSVLECPRLNVPSVRCCSYKLNAKWCRSFAMGPEGDSNKRKCRSLYCSVDVYRENAPVDSYYYYDLACRSVCLVLRKFVSSTFGELVILNCPASAILCRNR